jgi:hypothetical protein
VPWLARILGKFVLDILPAALASVIGGFLFTQYHLGQMRMPQPAADQGAPASVEMVAMVRDEHALIMNYLKAQMAAEKSRDVADDAAAARAAADAQTAADAKLAEALRASQAAAQPSAAPMAKPHAHPKPPVAIAAAPHAPLVIAQSDQNPNDALAPDVAPGEAIARDPNSLLAAWSRSLAICSPRSATALAVRCQAAGNLIQRLDGLPAMTRHRMKPPLPPTHRAVHNNRPVCQFATELPSICTENDAFWQQAAVFACAASCGVPSPSVSHNVSAEGTASAAVGFAHRGQDPGSPGPGIKLALMALGIQLRAEIVLRGGDAFGR